MPAGCLAMCLVLGVAVQSLPQPEADCGADRLTGAPRQEGDTWSPDGCNNCRCLASGRPGCTKKFCQTQGEGACSEGARWEERSGSEQRVCDCILGTSVCSPQAAPFLPSPQSRPNLPQPETDCGADRLTGAPRQEGDTWSPDGCNNCRCLASGRPGCTKKFCQSQGEGACSEGARWEERSGSELRVCDCILGTSVCSPQAAQVLPSSQSRPAPTSCQDSNGTVRQKESSWEQDGAVCTCREAGLVICKQQVEQSSPVQCGAGNDGRKRQVGDSWQESCNTCRCTGTGVAACTQRACLEEPSRSGLTQRCTDSRGGSRELGEQWEEQRSGQNTNCVCSLLGLVSCTHSQGVSSRPQGTEIGSQDRESSSRINFPTEPLDRRKTGVCLDSVGGERSVGQEWTQECNLCRCLALGTSCTKKLCPQADTDLGGKEKADSLLQEVDGGARPLAQCQQGGVTRCRVVRLNPSLRDIRAGAVLSLLSGTGVTMELRRDPEVTSSGGLALALRLTDGGEATVVVGKSGGAFGSINPVTGSVHYVLESCGQDCTVLLERDRGFFNQFED